MVGPNLAHSRISLYRIFFVPDDTQTCFPPAAISPCPPAAAAPHLLRRINPSLLVRWNFGVRRITPSVLVGWNVCIRLITMHIKRIAPSLLALPGFGPLMAAKIVGETADV